MGKALRIFHLAPHFGGGVGTVVRALVSASTKERHAHSIGCLEGLNEVTAAWASAQGVEASGNLWDDGGMLDEAIRRADIVLIHWWHHPLLNALMHRPDLPPFRCAVWSHVNGLHAPQNIPGGLASYADLLVLATPASLDIPHLQGNEKVRVVQSNAGPPSYPRRQRREAGFRIGYAGTVDDAKMHPDFVRLSLAAALPDARFIVAGGPKHEELKAEIAACGAASRFEVTGPLGDLGPLLLSLDVFGYPLSPWHYGTGEQVLIEAMTAGAVPVVLDNSCERHIVEHERTGLVCADAADYPRALERLHADRTLLARLSRQAREEVHDRFALSKTAGGWHALYRELMECPPRPHALAGCDDAFSLLMEALADTQAGQAFARIAGGEGTARLEGLPSACFSATRGSPFHYLRFFPDDPLLARLCGALLQETAA